VPTIAIFWIKFTQFYQKPFPAPGVIIEDCRLKIEDLYGRKKAQKAQK
jgi:hypothetical protein